MHIHFTEAAVQAVYKQLGRNEVRLKLVYDSEGCGCAVSGIAALWAVNETSEHEADAVCEAFPVTYNRHQEVFFEDYLTVDVNTNNGAFVLKSKGQIYNNRMVLTDRTFSESSLK